MRVESGTASNGVVLSPGPEASALDTDGGSDKDGSSGGSRTFVYTSCQAVKKRLDIERIWPLFERFPAFINAIEMAKAKTLRHPLDL